MVSRCPKCGSVNMQGQRFCVGCGVEIVNNLNPTSQVVQNNEIYPSPQVVSNPQMNQNQQNNGQKSVDDILIDNFIGKNVNKILTKSFSFPAFFFGPIYMLYRKLYLYGFALWVFNIIMAYFLPSFYMYINIGVSIALALIFNKLYLNHAHEEISKIKQSTAGLSIDAIVLECRRKGGTNKLIPIVFGIIYLIYYSFVFFFLNANDNMDRLECKSNEGNITIYYNDNSIVAYKAIGFTYDLDGQADYAKEIGLDQYSVEFNKWFEENSSGTCKYIKVSNRN